MKQSSYRDVLPRFVDMATFAADARELVGTRGFEIWVNDKGARYGVERALELLGEAARAVPESVKNEFPSIPWRKMVAMRTGLAHDYGEIQHEILYRTVREILPPLELDIRRAIVVIEDRGNTPLL